MAIYDVHGNEIASGGGGHDYSFLTGKPYVAIGDSIVLNSGTKAAPVTVSGVELYGYTQFIEDRYGLVCSNRGQSGHTIVQDYGSLVAINYATAALVTIGYGVNDGRLDVPLGTRDSSDVSTFAGALGSLLKKIYGDNKDCRVLVLTPIQRQLVNGWGSYTANGNGNTLEDFAEMCKSVAGYYATACVDLFHSSGINATTVGSLTFEGVHPNNRGYNRMANAILQYTDALFDASRNFT